VKAKSLAVVKAMHVGSERDCKDLGRVEPPVASKYFSCICSRSEM